MSGYAIEKKKFISPYLGCIICTLFILLTAGCGSDASAPAPADKSTADAGRTGSASFSVKWHTNDTVSVAAHDRTRSAIADCTAIGVTKISCTVYDENNNPVASSKQWDCTDGGANMERIPEGSNLTFTILAWDTADGNIVYQGTAEKPVTIVAGETTDAGTIHANPFVPTGFEASATAADQIELIWEDMGTPSYRVYQNGTAAATPTSPDFGVSGLSQGTNYCYTVSAVDVFGNESGQSIEACATTGSPDDDQAPTTPTDAAAAAVSASQIDISWSAATDDVGVSGYRVYRDGQEAGTTTLTSFSDEALQANTQYCYTIEAYDASDNQSAHTDQICATTSVSTDTEAPTTPIGLDAVAISTSQIDIAWSASTDNVGVTGYRVYRDGQAPATTASPSYSEENLEPNTQYCYTVEAYDAADNPSPQSAQVCATTMEAADTEAPATPTGVEARAVSASQIDLSWSASTDNVGVTGYWVYRDGERLDPSVTSTSFSDGNRQAGALHCYTVAAHDAAGNVSPQSVESCATTPDLLTWYRDADQDTFGNPAEYMTSETQPDGYVEDNSDCDDTVATTYPGADEICYDGDDNDCSGGIDDRCSVIYPTSSFTARYIYTILTLVADASDHEGEAFNSTFLSIKEGTSDRVCVEFETSDQTTVSRVTLNFDMSNMDDPDYSTIGVYRYQANGLANAYDYWGLDDGTVLIQHFSDYGASGENAYTIDVTDAYRSYIYNNTMGIRFKTEDTNARYSVYNPKLMLTYE